MARITHIERLKTITTQDLAQMNINDLRNFVAKSSKSVYDTFRKTEKYIQSHSDVHSKYVEDRNKTFGSQKEYRPRRILRASAQKMNRRQLMQEVKNLTFASKAQTITIKGSIKYTESLKAKGIDPEKLNQISPKMWDKIRALNEFYGSETVLNEYDYTDELDNGDSLELRLSGKPDVPSNLDETDDDNPFAFGGENFKM